jgi:hypothetical protein
MELRMPNLPTNWTPETPSSRTFDDLKVALNNCVGGSAQVVKDTWQYTTWTQDIYNWWIAGLWSSGGTAQDRKFSVGTAIRIYFYCAEDEDLHESREIVVSRTYAVKDCVLTVTHTSQTQDKFKRTWARWTLTAVFEDDFSSSAVNAIVGSALSLLGIPATGAATTIMGVVGAIAGLASLLKDAESILIRKDTADGGEIWVDHGPPSSGVDEQIPLPDDICETVTDIFTPPVTVPVQGAGR